MRNSGPSRIYFHYIYVPEYISVSQGYQRARISIVYKSECMGPLKGRKEQVHRACRESKISDSWVANQYKIWFELKFANHWWFTNQKSIVLFNKRSANQRWFANQSWIESLKKRFESTFSLGLSKKIATIESQIFDSGSQQALLEVLLPMKSPKILEKLIDQQSTLISYCMFL